MTGWLVGKDYAVNESRESRAAKKNGKANTKREGGRVFLATMPMSAAPTPKWFEFIIDATKCCFTGKLPAEAKINTVPTCPVRAARMSYDHGSDQPAQASSPAARAIDVGISIKARKRQLEEAAARSRDIAAAAA